MSTSNHPFLEYSPVRHPLLMMEKTVKWRPNKIELAPNCPRCSSSNTKFCYYNNYSVSQPRYFCKGCRRYWTKGGSLRNVPIGGGCRKSRSGRASARPPSVESKDGSGKGGDTVFAQNYESSNLAESAAGDQFRQVHECIDGQDFVYQNFDGFDVEGVFGAEVWTDGMNLQGFGSQQPLMQLQEFEVFSSDDHLRMSENLIGTDNWGSFDLSGYEDF